MCSHDAMSRAEARQALCASSSRRTTVPLGAFPLVRGYVWSGAGSNRLTCAYCALLPDLGTHRAQPGSHRSCSASARALSAGQLDDVTCALGLPGRFSNPRPALKALISRVLRGSEGRRPRVRSSERRDTRGPVVKKSVKSQTRLSPAKRAELVADYVAGMPVQMIAAKYGVHRGTIPMLALRAGAPIRTPGLEDAVRRRAAALYADGLTLREVAERLAIDDKTVRNAVVAASGSLRPRGRRPARWHDGATEARGGGVEP
jgi:transposase-like protein